MKRVLLVLSMVVSLFALSACSNKNAAEAETMDPQTASYISQISENLLQTIAEMDEATAEESETGLLKQGEDGLASGLTSWIGVMKDTGASFPPIPSLARMISMYVWFRHSLRNAT